MRKIIIILLVVVFTAIVIYFLPNFSLGTFDIYGGRRPIDFNETKWVSNDLNSYFEVSNKFLDITGSTTYGKIIIDDDVTEILLLFDISNGVSIMEHPIIESYVDKTGKTIMVADTDKWLFKGKCRFTSKKLTIEITDNSRGYLDDSIKRIVYVREK